MINNTYRAPKHSVRLAPESAVQIWQCLAPKAHSLEEVLAPGYLGERVKDLRPGAIVMITHEDHDYFVELYIRAIDRDLQAVQSIVLRAIDLREAEVVSEDWSNATLVYEGARGWGVKLGARTCRVGFKTEAEARAFVGAKQTLARAGRASSS